MCLGSRQTSWAHRGFTVTPNGEPEPQLLRCGRSKILEKKNPSSTAQGLGGQMALVTEAHFTHIFPLDSGQNSLST